MRARRPCLFSSSFGTFRRVHSRQIHARVPLHTSTLNLTRVTHVSAPSALPPALSRAGLATLCGIYSVARSSGHIPAGMWWPIISLLGMLDDIESVICSPVWVAPNFFFFDSAPALIRLSASRTIRLRRRVFGDRSPSNSNSNSRSGNGTRNAYSVSCQLHHQL